jgi:hypothetical protein
MRPITRVHAQLTAEGQFASASGVNASLSVFIASDEAFTGTLVLQCRPTPRPARPGTSVAGNPALPAETPVPWSTVASVTLASGLNIIPLIPGEYDFQVGATAPITGTADVFLFVSNFQAE